MMKETPVFELGVVVAHNCIRTNNILLNNGYTNI
ncbi:hypothetical protein CLV24_11738 [Pontibacter ummariensis]|uniref:Uncharacterized protein n=1 Tax=Pontibacter ummariensis TaxID=1610492 RepID=A0A239IG82_9BACT|nr:hypothetical protein CLV24_11738 [Pontibacter ummariensis]SNS92571.1 hypothetical protein SAMN06296052_11738 [Pontibacter ummariensis]